MPSKDEIPKEKKDKFRQAVQKALSSGKKSLSAQEEKSSQQTMGEEKTQLRRIDPRTLPFSETSLKTTGKKWALIIALVLAVALIVFLLIPGKKPRIYLANSEIFREQIRDIPEGRFELSAQKSIHVFFDFGKRINRDVVYLKIYQISEEGGTKKETEMDTREAKLKPEWSYLKYIFQEYTFAAGQDYKLSIADKTGKTLSEVFFTVN
ncbi:MAG: hypothetical protein NZM25_01385 [Leptospiraceae bacterium]|nr:hypothetical protein [Leptospiraceae bacterium]